MAIQLTANDAKNSLTAHVEAKGGEINLKHGPHVGWRELVAILNDNTCTRYPCEIVFDATPLAPGEMAFPVPKGDRPQDGFKIHVHPLFMTDLARVPAIVLYQLVVVNYGEFASSDDAEAFGAAALGIHRQAYYENLCQFADELAVCEAE